MRNSTNARRLIPVRIKGISRLALALTAFLIVGCTQRGHASIASANCVDRASQPGCGGEPSVSHNAGSPRGKGLHRWVVRRQQRAPALHEVVFLRGAARKRGRHRLRDRRRRRGRASPGRDAERFMRSPQSGSNPISTTLACPPGSVCLNHPAMIDASRVGGRGNGPGVPHSHIVEEHGGGWRHTVNIRVFNLDAWNQIAAAKSLAKVRELQGGSGNRSARGHQRGHPDEHLLLHCLVAGRVGVRTSRVGRGSTVLRGGARLRGADPFVANHCPGRSVKWRTSGR